MYRPVGVFETEPTVSLISVQSKPREQSILWSSLAKCVKKTQNKQRKRKKKTTKNPTQIQVKHRKSTFLVI